MVPREQEKRWDDAITRASVSGGKVDINCSPELYDPREGRQTKEKVLREGFAQAAGSIAVHFVDQEVDFKVIKNMMEEYAKSCHVEVSEEEVVNYMKDAFHKMNEAVKDFSYSYKIMK